MKLAIVGSRTFGDYELLKQSILDLFDVSIINEIVSGRARGADVLGERFANEFGIKTTIFYPDWNKFGKSAGYIRNRLIVEYSDYIIAFWDGVSRGTKNGIDLAKKMNKPCKIVKYEK